MSNFKIYYTPTSCGAATYITASLAGLTFESEQVNLGTKKTASGADFKEVNPKGNVPTLVIKEGNVVLNENIATLTYVADKNPAAKLAPAAGTTERYQYLNVLSFLATEMHQSHAVLFGPGDDATKEKGRQNIIGKVKIFTESYLTNESSPFLFGADPSAADIYAYIILTWGAYGGIDHAATNTKAVAFMERVKALPSVQKAMEAMAAAPSA